MKSIRINYKKLRQARKSKNLSILEVSEKTGIPAATLQKYESGIIKKVPLDLLKKICKLYKKNYKLYSWWTEISSISEIIFYFISNPNFFLKENELFKMLKIEEYFKVSDSSNAFSCLYNKLTQEEKEEYLNFKSLSNSYLKLNKYFKNEELEKEDISLFCFFYANKIKIEKNINLDILKEFWRMEDNLWNLK